MSASPLRHGDYTGLAEDYARYRPAYSDSVLTALLALFERPAAALDAADVGAGTGVWTRMLAGRGLHSVTAVEPNDDMRRVGMETSTGLPIQWRTGRGEETGLGAGAVDLLSMASSFHWVDFETGLSEFHRVLRPGGRFVALWNPRLIEVNPLLVEIEAHLFSLCPDLKRVSSGRSGLTESLSDRLWAAPGFDDLVYLEARRTTHQTPDAYLGAWRSVNDVRIQLGSERFAAFMAFVEERLQGMETIETVHLTRAWTVRRS